jgi:flagellar biogenesis protein FliO
LGRATRREDDLAARRLKPANDRKDLIMYIGGGLLVVILIIVIVVFLLRR